jgi:glutathione S-transferase
MKLYGNPASTCTRKVLTVLAEKGKTAEFITKQFNGEMKQPDYTAKQPFGQVPCLEDDDGFTLFESRAICRYLDEKFATDFTPHAMTILYATLFGKLFGNKPVDTVKLEEGRTKIAPTLDIMAKQLEKTPFISGSKFTLADVSFMPYIDYLYAAEQGDLFESRPALAKWWKGVSDRKSWQIATGKATA